MSDEVEGGDRRALLQAQETIARQAEELESLRSRLAGESFAEELREALATAAAAGTIASPVSHSGLLQMIVETAAHVISAQAGSLFLIDEATQELVFEVALGQKAEEVKKFRVPLGHGIAGLVAATGQPMAISDAQSDPRQASDIARSIGYTPQSILCVPLYYQDQIIGVLQLLDKVGAPSFTPGDMELLSLFASQAAVAIEQSRTYRNLTSLIREVLASFGSAPEEQERLQREAGAFAASIEADPAYGRALNLARLVREIAWQGDNELKACQAILNSFAEYLRSRSSPMGLGGPAMGGIVEARPR
jgi:GAF domain-containing protein